LVIRKLITFYNGEGDFLHYIFGGFFIMFKAFLKTLAQNTVIAFAVTTATFGGIIVASSIAEKIESRKKKTECIEEENFEEDEA